MNSRPPVYVTGLGVVCAGASNVDGLRALLARPRARFGRATVFPIRHPSGELPVAETSEGEGDDSSLPRTHRLALLAARQAVGDGPAPDAIVLGTTTGGIAATEAALEAGNASPAAYRFHGLDTVARWVADQLGVEGPVITISTACSSAAVALSVAARLLRAGVARRVLAGGADSLSRLTFHGFRQLQLVAADGCHPLDAQRTGMTVAEGSGALLLEADVNGRPALAALAGAGLSCDAYHATSPHPEGRGAALAIERTLDDAGLAPQDIDYVNLHGTGTPDNDAAEARAMRRVFGDVMPALSSTKGLTGHALAAAGGIEAVISVLSVHDGVLPANTGLGTLDPTLGLEPVREPTLAPLQCVLSSSFGFGGNNACLVFQKVGSAGQPPKQPKNGEEQRNREEENGSAPALRCRSERAPLPEPQPSLRSSVPPCSSFRSESQGDRREGLPGVRIIGSACLTARGGLDETWAALSAHAPVAGLVPDAAFANAAPAAFVRRLKRLPRLTLALARTAYAGSGCASPPDVIAAGTAWGPLAETHAFLRKLFESGDQFSSPMDFVGSVHNAPAAQVALLLGSQAPNLTCSGGERSFSQALLCASLELAGGAASALLVAAEAFEPGLSPLFEPEVARHPLLSDGGAAFMLVPDDRASGPRLRWLGEATGGSALAWLERLTHAFPERYDAALIGWPAGHDVARDPAHVRLRERTQPAPIVGYRDLLGQHASVGATMTAVAARAVARGTLPLGPTALPLAHRRLLIVEFGARTAALEVYA